MLLISAEGQTAVLFEHGGKSPPCVGVSPSRVGGRRKWGEDDGQPVVALLQQQHLQTQTYVVRKEEEEEEVEVVFHGKCVHVYHTGYYWLCICIGDLPSGVGKMAVVSREKEQLFPPAAAGEAVRREPVASSEEVRSVVKQAWVGGQPLAEENVKQGQKEEEKVEEEVEEMSNGVAQGTEEPKPSSTPQSPGEGGDPVEHMEKADKRNKKADEPSAAMGQPDPASPPKPCSPPEEKANIVEEERKSPRVAMSARTVYRLLKEEEEKEESLCPPVVSVGPHGGFHMPAHFLPSRITAPLWQEAMESWRYKSMRQS